MIFDLKLQCNDSLKNIMRVSIPAITRIVGNFKPRKRIIKDANVLMEINTELFRFSTRTSSNNHYCSGYATRRVIPNPVSLTTSRVSNSSADTRLTNTKLCPDPVTQNHRDNSRHTRNHNHERK